MVSFRELFFLLIQVSGLDNVLPFIESMGPLNATTYADLFLAFNFLCLPLWYFAISWGCLI